MDLNEFIEDTDENIEGDLDDSWIHETEKLEKIEQNYIREPMEFIDTFFIYINSNSYIEKILSEKHPLVLLADGKTNVLKKEYILQLIQSKKIKTNHSKYKFIDMITFNVDLEPEHIQSYSKNENISENSKKFFNVLPIIDDVLIPPSIFVFHGINSIFFIFQEKEFDVSQLQPKSILKSVSGSQHKTTKKVKIMIGGVDVSANAIKKNRVTHKRFTRKHL
jgi:hypothetical protein